MALDLVDLTDEVRRYMMDEIEADVKSGRLYLSPRLSDDGRRMYHELLHRAATNGNADTLAGDLRSNTCISATEQRKKPGGHGTITAKVPHTAPQTLAEGEFNRFYIRGVCRHAAAKGIASVVCCRAKAVENPRPDSQAKIGERFSAEKLLADLRANPGVDTAFGLPAGPNSGLSARLP